MKCPCGCQREVLSKRATYYSARCRAKVSQAKRAPVPVTVRATRILKDGPVVMVRSRREGAVAPAPYWLTSSVL